MSRSSLVDWALLLTVVALLLGVTVRGEHVAPLALAGGVHPLPGATS